MLSLEYVSAERPLYCGSEPQKHVEDILRGGKLMAERIDLSYEDQDGATGNRQHDEGV